MGQFTGLSIIIPTVDETRAAAETVDILTGICRVEDICEILFVHSASSSEEHIRALHDVALSHPDISVQVSSQPGRGLGDALYYGCTRARGSHLFMIGADLENDPYDLVPMLALAKEHPDTVITSSRKKKKDGMKEYSALKHFLSDVFDWLMKIFFGSRQTDVTYAYQITPAVYFDPSFFSGDHRSFVLELALMTDIRRLPFIEIPTKIARRREGVSHSGFGYYAGFVKTAVEMYKKMKAGNGR